MIATFRASAWRGVLLLGPSGAGKSDLALRCLDRGWRLVADDRVIAWSAAGRAFGRAPSALLGMVELRGQGLAACPALAWAQITHVVSLASPKERQPEPAFHAVAGVSLPAFTLMPFEASAPARLRRIVEGLERTL